MKAALGTVSAVGSAAVRSGDAAMRRFSVLRFIEKSFIIYTI